MEESEGGGIAAVTADLVAGVTFSQLLFSEEAEADNRDGDGVFNFSTPFYSADEKPPKMLCFGDYNHNNGSNIGGNLVFVNETIQNCGGVIACSTTTDSSSTSSANNNNNSSTNSVPKSNRKRNGCNGNQAVGQSLSSRSQRNCKKARSSENSTTGGHAKVKKERLGERIAALQQLVSPFGKTDTSSVLHEAMGYIKFLQAQVQVLCSPYLHPSNLSEALPLLHDCCEENGKVELKVKDLRSRGLCLVPVECTLQVADSNGADFWSPATTVNNASSDHH